MAHHALGGWVKFGLPLMGMYEQVGVDGDHGSCRGSRRSSMTRLMSAEDTDERDLEAYPADASRRTNVVGFSARDFSSASMTRVRKVRPRFAIRTLARRIKPSGISMVVRIHKCITSFEGTSSVAFSGEFGSGENGLVWAFGCLGFSVGAGFSDDAGHAFSMIEEGRFFEWWRGASRWRGCLTRAESPIFLVLN